jgi:carbohydrate-selective porin OprB
MNGNERLARVAGVTALIAAVAQVGVFKSATRLYELWFEQKLLEDKLSIRFGQLGADSEFMISQGAAAFLNGTWGWLGAPSDQSRTERHRAGAAHYHQLF